MVRRHYEPALHIQAAAAGIAVETVRSRINRGWTLEDALHTPPTPRHLLRQTERTALALANGLRPDTVRARMRRGWSLERATQTPVAEVRSSLRTAGQDVTAETSDNAD